MIILEIITLILKCFHLRLHWYTLQFWGQFAITNNDTFTKLLISPPVQNQYVIQGMEGRRGWGWVIEWEPPSPLMRASPSTRRVLSIDWQLRGMCRCRWYARGLCLCPCVTILMGVYFPPNHRRRSMMFRVLFQQRLCTYVYMYMCVCMHAYAHGCVCASMILLDMLRRCC